MADTKRTEFTVVFEGASLDEAQKKRVNEAIQKAVASALLHAGDAGSAKAFAASAQTWSPHGHTNGIVYRPQ